MQPRRERTMGGRRLLVFALLTLVFAFGFSTPWQMQAQDNSAPSTMASIDSYLMDRDAEIAMARSAGPNSISTGPRCWFLDGMAMKRRWRGRTISYA